MKDDLGQSVGEGPHDLPSDLQYGHNMQYPRSFRGPSGNCRVKVRALLVGTLAVVGVALGTSTLRAQSGGQPPADEKAEVVDPQDGEAGSNQDTGGDEAPAHDGGTDVEELSPRVRYNRGLESHRAGAWEEAAASFLQARDEAGGDTELRFRAAFNLGLALAEDAAALVEQKPQEGIDRLRQSAAWYRDAVRLRPEDDDARVNLELVLRRIQILADQLNQGANNLQARLDRVIDDQRGLRDRVRQLLVQVEAAGAAAEPIAFQADFDDLATLERTLLTETGAVSDLAGEELSLLEGGDEEELTDADRMRLAQLYNLDVYLQRSRQSLGDARRRLRRLEGDRAHRRADAALAELKRAREQLLDPVTVLKGVLEDENLLLLHTSALDQLRRGAIKLAEDQPAQIPPWLHPEHLGERQQDAGGRTGEVLSRFTGGVVAADSGGTVSEAGPPDPKQDRVLAAAREAIPHLEEAAAAMAAAGASLASEDLVLATQEESRSIEALFRAIERFAGTRQLIELAHGEQTRVVTLVTPPREIEGQIGEALAEMSTEDRLAAVREGVTRNRDRLTRLKELLQEELLEMALQAAAAVEEGGGDSIAVDEQQKAVSERYKLADEYRVQALDALVHLAEVLVLVESGSGDPESIRGPAIVALAGINDLRRLFFTIVEHLKELLRNQAETHDNVASAQLADEGERRALEVGPLTDRQELHAQTGDALAQALESQADGAVGSGDPQAEQAAKALGEAAVETRAASGQMNDAAVFLGEARETTGAEPYDLEPILEHQRLAMEHLENAIRLLEPQQQQQQPEDQSGGQQQEPSQGEDEEQVTQRQADRRLQAIRDREAERQRQRRERRHLEPEPVEKDW